MGGRGAVLPALVLVAGLLLASHEAGGSATWLAALGGMGTLALAAACVPALALAWLGARRGTPPVTGTLAVLLALALAAGVRGTAALARLEAGRTAVPAGGTWVRVTGTVCEPPADAGDEPAVIVAVARSEPALSHAARLRLRCPAGTRVEWSDHVQGLAWLDPPDAPRNPGGFDARRYAAANALLASGRFAWCRAAPGRGPGAWPRATFGRWRTAFERRLRARLEARARELVWPLVLGDRSDMPPALGAGLRVTGLVHLIALSGLHVAWLAALARVFAAAAGAGPRARALAGAACAVGYVGLAGPIPSLARAAASELVTAGASLASRRADPLQSLAVSAIALLAWQPAWIDDLGFLLSCTATLGLITAGAAGEHVRGRIAGAAVRLLVPTLGAQAVSLPLVLATFHLLPWVAPAANLLAVPVCGWLLAAAWFALAADTLVPGLGAGFFSACDALAAMLDAIVAHAAAVPGAAIAAGHDRVVVALAALGAALLAWACARRAPPASDRPRPSRLPAALCGATLAACAALLAACGGEVRPPPGRAWLVALDVGQGDGIALAFADGWWLVDAGARAPRFDTGEQVVLPFLRWAGVRRLHGLVITHDDSDHAGGAPAVLRGVPVDRVIVPAPLTGAPPPLLRFRGDSLRAGATLHASPPLVVRWPPAAGDPFAPPRGVTPDNAGGVVLELGSGGGRALLMADVDSTAEARLAVAPSLAVLKAGHHGSATSTGAAFLARARPRVAILSCGRRNRFGHPALSTLERLAAHGVALARTDTGGCVWFELDERGARRIDWRAGEPRARREPRIAAAAGGVAPRRE